MPQELLTEGATARSSGELPWPDRLRGEARAHTPPTNEAALKELARVYVCDAFKRWVPGNQIVALSLDQDSPALTLRVSVRER